MSAKGKKAEKKEKKATEPPVEDKEPVDLPDEEEKKSKKDKKKDKKKEKKEKKDKKGEDSSDEEAYVPLSNEDALKSLNAEQKEALDEMKKRYKEEAKTTKDFADHVLLRFLYARKFNVDRALAIFKNYTSWYASIDADALSIATVRRMLDKEIMMLPKGVDKEGRTLLLMQPGFYYPSSMPVPELIASVIYTLEVAIESHHTQVHGFTFIADLHNWGWSNFAIHYASSFFDTLQNRFPARCGCFIMLDAPYWFNMIWTLIRPMMSAKFANRVNFVAKKDLQKFIDEENLPEFLGGKNTYSQKQFIKDRYKAEGLTYSENVDEAELDKKFANMKITGEKASDPGKPEEGDTETKGKGKKK